MANVPCGVYKVCSFGGSVQNSTRPTPDKPDAVLH